MQKTMFIFALALLSLLFLPSDYVITDENIRLGQVLTLLITIGFYVFSAILILKNRVRSWKSISLLILYSVAYFFLLITRIVYIPNISEYFLPAYFGLISLLVLTAGIYVLRNKDSLPSLQKAKKQD